MYMAPRKYPGSLSKRRLQTGHRSDILGNPRKTERGKIFPERQRGQRWRSISRTIDLWDVFIGWELILSLSEIMLDDPMMRAIAFCNGYRSHLLARAPSSDGPAEFLRHLSNVPLLLPKVGSAPDLISGASFLWAIGRLRFNYFQSYFIADPKFLPLNPAHKFLLLADESADCQG